MQRSIVAICVLLAFCAATAQAQQICAPPTGSVNFTCLAGEVIEQGFLSLDFRQNAMAANITLGFDQNGDSIYGGFIFINNTGYWIADGQCNQVQSNLVPVALLQRCLPPNGVIVPGNVAGVESATYIVYNANNATIVTVATAQPFNVPVSHTFSSFATATNPAYTFSLVYTDAVPSSDPSFFVLPAICNAAKSIPLKSIPAAHRVMTHLRFF